MIILMVLQSKELLGVMPAMVPPVNVWAMMSASDVIEQFRNFLLT